MRGRQKGLTGLFIAIAGALLVLPATGRADRFFSDEDVLLVLVESGAGRCERSCSFETFTASRLDCGNDLKCVPVRPPGGAQYYLVKATRPYCGMSRCPVALLLIDEDSAWYIAERFNLDPETVPLPDLRDPAALERYHRVNR